MSEIPKEPFRSTARIGTIEAILIKGLDEGSSILDELRKDQIEVCIAMSFAEWIKQLNRLPENCDIRKRITEAIFCAAKGLKRVF